VKQTAKMLLQAPDDSLENCDQIVVRCPSALSVSIAVAAALNLMSTDAYVRRAVIERLLADGLAVNLSPELPREVYQ
jgi:hypothetical protein